MLSKHGRGLRAYHALWHPPSAWPCFETKPSALLQREGLRIRGRQDVCKLQGFDRDDRINNSVHAGVLQLASSCANVTGPNVSDRPTFPLISSMPPLKKN